MNRRGPLLAVALTSIPVAFALGNLAARIVLSSPPSGIATDLAQPLAVVTAWHAFGAQLWAILASTIAVATVGAIVVIVELRRRPAGRTATLAVFAAAAATLAVAIAWPIVFSSDVYAYAAYGDLAARGYDPYLRNAVPAGDALAQAAAWQWGGVTPPCVYGPVFVALARAIDGILWGRPAWETLLLFRVIGSLAFLGAAGLLYVALAGMRSVHNRLAATAAFALNPVALWCVAEGHNDALMVLFAVAGVAIARRRSPLLGGAVIALSSLVKGPGLALGAALALCDAAARDVRRIGLGITAGAVLVVAVGAPVALRSLTEIGRHGRYSPQFSAQALGIWLARGLDPFHVAGLVGTLAVLAICFCVALVGIAALRARDPSWLAWLAIAAWLALPNPYPWYALWVLPLAVVTLDQPPFIALWAATISIVVRYLPDAYGPLTPDRQAMIAILELAPLLYALREVRWPLGADQPAVP